MKFLRNCAVFAIVLAALCLLLCACEKTCNHEYTSQITQIASCAVEGEETFQCKHCSDSYVQPIPVLEHSYVADEIEKAPTCSEEGSRIFTCSVCSSTKTEPVGKIAHTLGDTILVTKEPNCSEEGENSATCMVCGAEEVIEKIPINGIHVFEETVIREATCTAPGEGAKTCKLCRYSETCAYELKAHTYSKSVTKAPATCTENGARELTCSVCGGVTEETVPALGHTWVGATCTVEGNCSACSAKGTKASCNYVTIDDCKPSQTFAGQKTQQCQGCGAKKQSYYTSRYTFDLDAIRWEVENYARQKGFRISYESADSQYYRRSTIDVIDIERFGASPSTLITKGKERVDSWYQQLSEGTDNMGIYLVHVSVYYSQSGSLGGGWFGVGVAATYDPDGQ